MVHSVAPPNTTIQNEDLDDLYIRGVRENEPFILHMKDRPTIYGLSEDNGTPDDDSASVDGGIPPAGEQGCRRPDNPSIITITDDEEGEEGYRAANTPEEEGISAGSGEQGCRCPDNPSIITITDDEEGEEGYRAANTPSPAAGRHNLARVDIVYFFVDYVCEDHQYEEKVYWTSVSIEQF